MSEIIQKSLVSVAATNEVGAAATSEVFKFTSHTAHDLATKQKIHPRNAQGKTVCMISASDLDDKAVIVLAPNPTQDYLDNWNTEKYRPYFVANSTKVREANQIPLVFSELTNFYTFTATRVIVASEIAPIEERLALAGRPKSGRVSDSSKPQPQKLIQE